MKTLANFLIIFSGYLWTIETIPQIVHLVRTKKTEGISLPFFIICVTAYIFFLTGNFMLKNWSVVIAHAFPFINLIIINFLIVKYRRIK